MVRRYAVAVFMIIEITILELDLYQEYMEKVPRVIEKYGGKYIVRSGKVIPLSGNWSPERIIVIWFESEEHLRKCFASSEYISLAPLRERSTTGKAIMVEGSVSLS